MVILQLNSAILYYCGQIQELFVARFSQVSGLAIPHAETQVHAILVFSQCQPAIGTQYVG